jgi:hypothetical protein
MSQVEEALSSTSAVFCADSPSSDSDASNGGGCSNSRSSGFTNALSSRSRSIFGCQGLASDYEFDRA